MRTIAAAIVVLAGTFLWSVGLAAPIRDGDLGFWTFISGFAITAIGLIFFMAGFAREKGG